jgi:RNA polymerase sigma factor (sigma-70 family)
LAGLAAGDADAGLAFVRRFQRRIFGLALTILGDTAAAEDVAQEVLLRAWRHAQAYDPRRGSVATWVLSISRNLAIDTLRVRRTQPADPETVAALLAGSSEGPADDTILDPQTASDVRQALRDLPTDQRRALMLAAFAGHSAAEIAGIEGIPIGTAKTRVRTAMHKLRAALSEIGDQR